MSKAISGLHEHLRRSSFYAQDDGPSLTTIASGRRTIFPQPDGKVPEPPIPALLSVTPGSLVLLVIGALAGLFIYAAILILEANKSGPVAK